MPEIRQLSASVINKIAAGEVIERPSSVVKELVENSLDAGATRVDVSVAQGGLDLIRVSDDGCGIAAEQLPLAIASHATSKIRDADDLFKVGSLGFRGEALASIAEVSQFYLRSRPRDCDQGAELNVDGGTVRETMPCGCPVGTLIEVRNLFFNTPVRRKFLRTTQTEMGHITEAITRLALAWPNVHFTLRHNDKTLQDMPPTADLRERISAFFGGEIADGLIPVESRDDDIVLRGFVADPQHSRGNNRLQYFFLNGRCIRDKALQHALGEAYRGLILTGRYPIAFLRFEMPADAVDVNVHPTKMEVRFQDSGRLYSQLLGSLRKKFLTTDLVAKVQSATDVPRLPTVPTAESVFLDNANSGGHEAVQLAEHRRDFVRWATGQLENAKTAIGESVPTLVAESPTESAAEAELPSAVDEAEAAALRGQTEFDLQFESKRFEPLTLHRIDPAALRQQREHQAPGREIADASPVTRIDSGESLPRHVRGMQIQQRYLITETADGMEVIDQHALHERILYEQLRAKLDEGSLEGQRLLIPDTVPLRPAEYSAAIESSEVLAKLGINIEPFGGDTVLVTSYPAVLGDCNPAEIVRQAVERLVEGGKRISTVDLVNDLLNMVACKAAVKAGDYLAPEEIDSLLQQRHLFDNTHHCPHGRPTSLLFTRDELDKRFKRT
jgi:DNA mismatch repair protein MutL